MHESKEIKLSASKKIAEEILRSEELVETEDDKVTTEKEIVLLVKGQQALSAVLMFTQQRKGKLGVMQLTKIHKICQKNMCQLTIFQSFELT